METQRCGARGQPAPSGVGDARLWPLQDEGVRSSQGPALLQPCPWAPQQTMENICKVSSISLKQLKRCPRLAEKSKSNYTR